MKNVKTGLSDHDGVSCILNCKDIELRLQFYISRNFDMINAANLIPLIDEDNKLQSLFRDTNPNSIASKLNKGLNRVAEKLVVKKKIQNCKDMRDFDDREL